MGIIPYLGPGGYLSETESPVREDARPPFAGIASQIELNILKSPIERSES